MVKYVVKNGRRCVCDGEVEDGGKDDWMRILRMMFRMRMLRMKQ